jgi:hypothetical protein
MREGLVRSECYIFPNPVQNGLWLRTSIDAASGIVLCDPAGRRLNISFTETEPGLYHADVSSLAPGLYFVRGRKNGSVLALPVVKQ